MTNDDYHHSIPISVQILHDIVDHVIQEDEKKNVKARARAIRLAVQQAWLSSVSFQVSSGWVRACKGYKHIESVLTIFLFCLVLQ